MSKNTWSKALIFDLIVQPVYRWVPILFLALGTMGAPSISAAQPQAISQSALQLAVTNVRSADDLLRLYQNLAKIEKPSDELAESLAAVDFLAPLRDGKILLSIAEKEKIKVFLEKQKPVEGSVDWQGLKLGFKLIDDPTQAKAIVWKLLEDNKGLALDYFWLAAPVHRSLVLSIANLPKNIRQSLFAEVMTLRAERNKIFKQGTYANHKEEADAKLGVRDTQFLQTLLTYPEFKATLKKLNAIYKKSGMNEEFLATLESYLLPLRLGGEAYPMRTVLEMAVAMQSAFKTHFAKNDFAEIFGSFPNLNGNPKTSDLDVIFSDAIDREVRAHIKSGMKGNESFTPAEVEKMNAEGKKLAQALIAMEQQAANALGAPRPQGTLIGIMVLPIKQTPQGPVQNMTREQLMRFLTLISNVTVVITPQKVSLHIYDTLAPANNAAPAIFEFSSDSGSSL